jgi:probable rRNA maturation factor
VSQAQPTLPLAPELDLALRIETGDGDPLPDQLADLLARAGEYGSAAAEDRWQPLLSRWLAQLAGELPAELHSSAYSMGLLLTDDATITALNRQWRQRPEPTDVLAFAAQEEADEYLIPLPAGLEAALELGDIVISLETAARQAEEHDHSLAKELLFLASHGLLHLLGWDHPDQASLAVMLARQDRLMASVPWRYNFTRQGQ